MNNLNKEQEILKILFKEFRENYNSRSLSKKIGISHAGAFKILKKLENNNKVIGKRIGNAVIYSLNLKDKITEREVEIAITLESKNYNKWVEEFSELNKASNLIILFGSILRNEKEAKDIDILIVAEKSQLKNIKSKVEKKKSILSKPLHVLYQDKEDFFKDIKANNKVMLDILKTGIVLHGADKLIEIIIGL